MGNDSTFSQEYSIENSTNNDTDYVVDDKSTNEDKETIMKKIESDYQLLKPRRKIYHAKIIKK